MSAFSDNMAAVATSLITEFGETCTFTRTPVSSYDPSTSSTTLGTPVTFAGVCFQDAYRTAELEGSISIQRDDIKLLVAPIASGAEPKINDTVTFSGTTYRVINVSQTTTNSATVLFELQVRE